MVMLYHVELTFGVVGLFARGYLFVDFFFLLSGFVLTLSGEAKMAGERGAAGFLHARIVRLWPLAALGTLSGAVELLVTNGQESVALQLILAFLMIPSVMGTGQLFPLNGPQWSLFFELLANLLHASVLRKIDERRLLTLVFVAALALVCTIALFGSNTLGPFAFNWWWGLPRVCFSYMLGIWFARRWMTTPFKLIFPWKPAIILPPVGIIAVAVLPVPRGVGDTAVVLAMFPALFWRAVFARVSITAEPWLRRLGALSFPLYAVHLPIIRLVRQLDDSVPTMALAIACSLLGAWLIERAMGIASAKRWRPAPVLLT